MIQKQTQNVLVDLVEAYYVLKTDVDLTQHGFRLSTKTGNWGIKRDKHSKKLILSLFPAAKFPVIIKKTSPITRKEIDSMSWEKLCMIEFPESDK